jgi:hypothetical protein
VAALGASVPVVVAGVSLLAEWEEASTGSRSLQLLLQIATIRT